MESFRIGHTIKDLRRFYKISQQELAEGICTQAMISRIETDDLYPSAPLLYQIAEKLGVDINYFFNISETPRLDYAQEVCEQIRALVRKTKYREALEMIDLEKQNPLFRKGQFYQFLVWQEAICNFYHTRDELRCFTLLDEALSLKATAKNHLSEDEIEILTSKANIYCELEQYEKAIAIYKEGLTLLKMIPYIRSTKLEVRILYNMSRAYHLNNQYARSIETATKGISICLREESMYLLGELYYQKGESLFYQQNVDQALVCMDYSLWIFERMKNEGFYQYVKKEREEISKAM
ncbi:helix-turn-helix domain-containing protein [Alkalihalophilus pseudofirmus]|jgi:transcriptional regulator with XRE-family HTH domain|uniref:Helix-turn-helix domain-containing protein n=1 Tax=Alkalihalophilus pseudofirmus TaxID=79885 RepID=A0AAJ2NPV6_ALKPS|nr:helix-turn-helix domain-containing protein [Alkalihalophilus pseudofirmus]MDV2886399.1 helix-turn-helix domain-containing protein [Alkalihalophilus pseudofirmus]